MVTGILGKKLGMTQLFGDDGSVQPATVIQAGPCIVVQRKTAAKEGYDAVQLGLVEGRRARPNKPVAGHFGKSNVPPTRLLGEVRLEAGDALQAGDKVLVSVFELGERVDVIGISKGHGYQGVVKRHHFRGGAATHGSMFHRAPGSIGASSFPSRVLKGMRAAGRMGSEQVTAKNLRVLKVDAEKHLLVVRGSVPGAPNSYVLVRKAKADRKK